MVRVKVIGVFLLSFASFRVSAGLVEEDLGDLLLMSVSAADQVAVIRNKDHEFSTLSVGDDLLDGRLVIEKILVDKLLLKDLNSPKVTYLFYKTKDGESSRVQAFSSELPESERQQVFSSPAIPLNKDSIKN